MTINFKSDNGQTARNTISHCQSLCHSKPTEDRRCQELRKRHACSYRHYPPSPHATLFVIEYRAGQRAKEGYFVSIECCGCPHVSAWFHSSIHTLDPPSKYALQVNHPIPAKSPMNSTQEMKLDQLNMICTTKTKANSKLLCHAWNRT